MPQMVSIITASYNVEQYIEETIASVQSQTYQNWEMLITDDASTDNTCKIVEEIAKKDSRIKLYRLEQNSGPAAARNHSIEKAKGRFIAFLDADDLWYSEKLTIQVKIMIEQHISISYTSYQHIDETGTELNYFLQAIPSLSYSKLLKNNYIGNLTGMYDASKLKKIYQPNLKKRQDWCLWLEALKRSDKPAVGIQKVLAKYRIRIGSLSSNKFKLLKYNFLVYHQYLKLGFLNSLFYLLVFILEYFIVRPKYIIKNRT